MDYYAVLGVRPDASQDEIKEAYRQRALECHPDRAEEGERDAAKEEFLRVRRAFDVLSDSQARAQYDAGGETAEQNGTSPSYRKQSFKSAWRRNRNGGQVSVNRVILENVRGLSADHNVIHARTTLTSTVFAVLGILVFLIEPRSFYGTDLFFLDLVLCAGLGGGIGLVIGYVWGYVNLLLRDFTSNR